MYGYVWARQLTAKCGIWLHETKTKPLTHLAHSPNDTKPDDSMGSPFRFVPRLLVREEHKGDKHKGGLAKGKKVIDPAERYVVLVKVNTLHSKYRTNAQRRHKSRNRS